MGVYNLFVTFKKTISFCHISSSYYMNKVMNSFIAKFTGISDHRIICLTKDIKYFKSKCFEYI